MTPVEVATWFTLAISVFWAAIALIVYRGSRRLTRSIEGRDGYRLMFVINRVIAVLVVIMLISLGRQLLSILWGSELLELLRIYLPSLTNTILLGTVLWALLTVRGWDEYKPPAATGTATEPVVTTQDHVSDG